MSRSMLAAVQEAARGTGEPENVDDAPRATTANNPFVAGFTAAVDWMLGRGVEPSEARPESASAAARPAAGGSGFSRSDAAEIVTLCASAGFPAMAASLISDGLSVEDAKARVDSAKEIKAAVDLARKSTPSIPANQVDAYISAGTSIAEVRADLINKMANSQSPEITAAHQPGTTVAGGEGLQARAPDYAGIYAKRAKARAEWAAQ